MRYLKTENDLTDEEVRPILESLGYAKAVVELPELVCESGESYFGIDPEVYEMDDDLFLKIDTLSEAQRKLINEDTELVNSVEYNGNTYTLDEEVYELEGESFVHLHIVENTEEDEEVITENSLEIDGVRYLVVDSEEESSSSVYLKATDDDSEFDVVDSEDDADFIAYLRVNDEEDDD